MRARPCLGCGGEIILTSTCRDLFLCSPCHHDLLEHLARTWCPSYDPGEWHTWKELQAALGKVYPVAMYCWGCEAYVGPRYYPTGEFKKDRTHGKYEVWGVREHPTLREGGHAFCSSRCLGGWEADRVLRHEYRVGRGGGGDPLPRDEGEVHPGR